MKKTLTLIVTLTLYVGFAQKKPEYKKLDKENIQATYFNKKGFVKEIGTFKKGKLHGKWMVYNENKKPIVFANYKEGKKHGEWKFILDEAYYLITYFDNRIVSSHKVINGQKSKIAYVK